MSKVGRSHFFWVYACTDGVYRDTRHHLSTSGSHNRNARQVADVENNFITSCKHVQNNVLSIYYCAQHAVRVIQ